MSEPYTAVRVVMMPRDTNPHGTIFGGVILSHIDTAGAIAARRELLLRGGNPRAVFVTVAIGVQVARLVVASTRTTRPGELVMVKWKKPSPALAGWLKVMFDVGKDRFTTTFPFVPLKPSTAKWYVVPPTAANVSWLVFVPTPARLLATTVRLETVAPV